MKSETSKGLRVGTNAQDGRRNLLTLLGGGGVLLLANGCAMESSEAEPEAEPEAVGSVMQQANTPQGINLCYKAAFNRWATSAEISYWAGTLYNNTTIIKYLRKWMRTSDGVTDRVHVIQDAYLTVYGRMFGGAEWGYWNNYLLNNDAMFCELCKWLESYGRDGGFAHIGWYTIKHAYKSVWQPDTSIENYSGKTYNVPV